MIRDLPLFDVARLSPVAFAGLTAAARCELAAALTLIDLPAQASPFGAGHAGAAAPLLAFVAEGCLRLQFACATGRSQIAALLLPGDLVERGHDAQDRMLLETVTETRLCVLRADRAAAVLSRHPSLRRAMAELRTIKLDQARWLADALARLTAEERIVSFLVLATRWMPWQPLSDTAGMLTLTVPRLDVANLLASSVETISRVLVRLDREGLIEIRGAQCFHLLDMAALSRAGRLAPGWRNVRFARPGLTLFPPGLPLLAEDPAPRPAARTDIAQFSSGLASHQ